MGNIKFKTKPISDQTIVITGATNGIGLATALMAARKGAQVVLAARNGDILDQTVQKIIKEGGKAIAVTTDVSSSQEMKILKDRALKEFGSIDTWINNAGTSIYGYLLDSDIGDEKKLFETNFWGARIGSAMAVDAMKKNGGVLINLGSEVAVAAQPLLGMYSASKYAVKAFTDALRSELRDKNIPVEVCLIRPTAIDDPFPQDVADAIIKCAENPQRDVYVGGPARLSAILDTFFPKVKDMMAETKMKELKEGTLPGHPDENAEITTLGILKTLKDNFKLSRNEKH